MIAETVADQLAQPCAVCETSSHVIGFGALVQVKCGADRHRTRYYGDRRSAVMAWNLSQNTKRSWRPGYEQ